MEPSPWSYTVKLDIVKPKFGDKNTKFSLPTGKVEQAIELKRRNAKS